MINKVNAVKIVKVEQIWLQQMQVDQMSVGQ